jgi:hypothetical protein
MAGAVASITRAARRSASKLFLRPFRKSATRAALGTAESIRAAFVRRITSSCQSSIISSPVSGFPAALM